MVLQCMAYRVPLCVLESTCQLTARSIAVEGLKVVTADCTSKLLRAFVSCGITPDNVL